MLWLLPKQVEKLMVNLVEIDELLNEALTLERELKELDKAAFIIYLAVTEMIEFARKIVNAERKDLKEIRRIEKVVDKINRE